MEPSRDQILEALEQVIDPELKRNVVELDMVRGVEIAGGEVTITIALTVAGCRLRSSFQDQADRLVGPLPGVEVGVAVGVEAGVAVGVAVGVGIGTPAP